MCARPPLAEMPMTHIHMTELSRFDAPWLSQMHRQAFTPAWSRQSFEDLLKLPTTRGWWAWYGEHGEPGQTATQAQAPLGFILFQVHDEEAEILTFQVDQSHQRKGVGRSLLCHAITTLGRFGAQRFYLDVAVSRLGAIELYQSQGFVVAGHRKNYYRGRDAHDHEDALVMHLALNS